MGAHEVQLGGGVVRGHEQVALVLVSRGVGAGGLGGGGKTLEIELVGVAFPVHLGHDVFVVVIPEGREENGRKELERGLLRLC